MVLHVLKCWIIESDEENPKENDGEEVPMIVNRQILLIKIFMKLCE